MSSKPATQKRYMKRFWSRVRRGRGNACWKWLGHSLRGHMGYGTFWYWGKDVAAHRLMWELKRGPIPFGICVCHHCDNPRCVNPRHLFVGTVHDNNNDKIRKNRHSKGVGTGIAKLTPRDVIAIRNDDRSGPKIGRDYGVSDEAIYAIRRRRTWNHV